jgi:uncharacterized protein YbbC (DUF1343 family)
MKWISLFIILLLPLSSSFGRGKVELGVDLFFKDGHTEDVKNKRVGLITNHTGLNADLRSTVDLFKEKSKDFTLVALFSPEHGLNGVDYAGESVEYTNKEGDKILIHSLHGKTRRPSKEMLQDIDVLIFDIQDIGVRPYTYAATLFYVMEEAVKYNIEVIVLDRPNPINGVVVDGPMLQKKWRSFIGYVNVPYCHGMTIGELALFFNEEYKVECNLTVIPMKGWERWMSFKDTGLHWVPTSPYVPEESTPVFSATTGLLGELSLVNIGIGYTLPFKIVGAPWINAKDFAEHLNHQKLPGVKFLAFHFRPMHGLYASKNCQGVKILITDEERYRPLAVQYLLLGMLKTLYPKEVASRLDVIDASKKKLFCQANGNDEILALLMEERYPAWKMIKFQEEQRKAFVEKRLKYLLY